MANWFLWRWHFGIRWRTANCAWKRRRRSCDSLFGNKSPQSRVLQTPAELAAKPISYAAAKTTYHEALTRRDRSQSLVDLLFFFLILIASVSPLAARG